MVPLSIPNALIEEDSTFIGVPKANEFLQLLMQQIPWEQKPVMIYGRQLMQPRLTAMYGKSYRYSGFDNPGLPWTPLLLDLKARVEAATGYEYTACLLNHYRDGNDTMGWHSDREKGMNPDSIACLSFGASRNFRLKDRLDPKKTFTISLGHGHLLHMGKGTQENYQHCIPAQKKGDQPRISLTFRII